MSTRLIDGIVGRSRPYVALPRRELLKRGLAATAGLLSGARAWTAPNAATAEDRRVIIVGAGFAGLACAYELMSVGYEVKVIEARRRVGGRVLTLHQLARGKSVEAGGEMVGSNHPHQLAYAAKFNLTLLDITPDDTPSLLMLGGRRISLQDAAMLRNETEAALGAMTADARTVNANEPWKTVDAQRLDNLTTASWIDGLSMSRLSKQLLTSQLMATNGVVTTQQSYLGNLAQVKGGGLERYWTETEVARFQGGNQQLAQSFARQLGNSRLALNCPVHEIVATDQRIVVVDAAGNRHEADDAVLAIPPSVWSSIKFAPELPKELSPQMGANVKYLAVVAKRFWRDRSFSPNTSADGDINATWEATDGQQDTSPFVVTSFSGGTSAQAIHRRPVADRQTAYMKELESLLPGINADFVKGQVIDWIGDPWTRGAYSFPAPGQITSQGPLMQSGVGRLHFAGEHTCYQFVGYMEGALHSGTAVAKRIAQRDGVAVPS